MLKFGLNLSSLVMVTILNGRTEGRTNSYFGFRVYGPV